MNSSNSSIASLALAALLCSEMAVAPAFAQPVEVGNAATVVGDVRLSNAEIKKPRQIERKQHIAWEDLINTGKKSQLQILLLDRSTFGIGANSRVRIDRFVYNPDASRSIFTTLIKGALRFFSGRQEGENNAEIQTPAGRIGIRGTALDLLVGESAVSVAEAEAFVGKVNSKKDEATLVVLRGPGANTEGGLAIGLAEVEAAGVAVVLDQPGLAAYIPRKGAPPIGPFAISDQGLAEVQDQLAPSVARAAKGGGLLKSLLPVAIGAATLGVLLSGDDNADAPTTPQRNVPTPGTASNPNSTVN